jgi:hypothetical protein
MTQLVGSFILVNAFACNLRTMFFATIPVVRTAEIFILVPRVQFMLDLAASGSFSGH